MGEVLGIGCTHAPHLQFPDKEMSNLLIRTLRRDHVPAAMRDPKNWPAGMREEWGDDEGMTGARKHRAVQEKAFRELRVALDAFHPDLVLIWGDDQYENFQVDVIPPFSVYALPEMKIAPFAASEGLKASANIWGEPTDTVVTLKGHQEAAAYLVDGLINAGFDVACSFAMHHRETLGHAFTRTVLYLDYDRQGWNYPVIPFHVNCYGINLRVPPGELKGSENFQPGPPPGPTPWRCYDLGKEVARLFKDSPWRVALVGSSSWSHGSLTEKHHFLYPDIEADRRRHAELQSGQFHRWRDLQPRQMWDSGQHEMLNWVTLAGAMEGHKAEVLCYTETYLFNSDKGFVLFAA